MAEGLPAATVVLLRESSAGVETLLLLRSQASDFGAGMAVFPGGRVDDDDWIGVPAGDELGAARIAAARETHEEAGLVIDPAALVPLSHWQPAATAPVRFFTWFFVAAAPEAVVAVDGGEIVEHTWMRPADAMAARATGVLGLMPPTWVTLEWLARHATIGDTLAAAAGREPPRFETRIVRAEGGNVFLYDGDAALATDPPDLTAPGPRRRLVTAADDWRWEEG